MPFTHIGIKIINNLKTRNKKIRKKKKKPVFYYNTVSYIIPSDERKVKKK